MCQVSRAWSSLSNTLLLSRLHWLQLRHVGLVAVATAGIATQSALAFQIFVPGGNAVHENITAEALLSPSANATLSTGVVVSFDGLYLFQVISNNVLTDGNFTSTQVHFDNEDFVKGSTRLIELRSAIVEHALAGNFSYARSNLGTALHSVQDFYAHTTWVDRNPSGAHNPALGVAVIDNPPRTEASCNQFSLVASPPMTSGYFDLLQARPLIPTVEYWTNYFRNPNWPSNKCIHGSTNGDGIHKDHQHRLLHIQAYGAAIMSTVAFWNGVLSDIRSKATSPRAADDAICNLMTGAACARTCFSLQVGEARDITHPVFGPAVAVRKGGCNIEYRNTSNTTFAFSDLGILTTSQELSAISGRQVFGSIFNSGAYGFVSSSGQIAPSTASEDGRIVSLNCRDANNVFKGCIFDVIQKQLLFEFNINFNASANITSDGRYFTYIGIGAGSYANYEKDSIGGATFCLDCLLPGSQGRPTAELFGYSKDRREYLFIGPATNDPFNGASRYSLMKEGSHDIRSLPVSLTNTRPSNGEIILTRDGRFVVQVIPEYVGGAQDTSNCMVAITDLTAGGSFSKVLLYQYVQSSIIRCDSGGGLALDSVTNTLYVHKGQGTVYTLDLSTRASTQLGMPVQIGAQGGLSQLNNFDDDSGALLVSVFGSSPGLTKSWLWRQR